MAEIAITDVVTTISLQDMDYSQQGRVKSFPTIAFGGGGLKYDTYGIPVPDFKKFGMKKVVKRLRIEQPPDGYEYRYDKTPRVANPVAPYGTIRIFGSAGFTPAGSIAVADHTHDMKVIGGITADEDVGVLASGPTLGKLAATDRTIVGADSATKGGVVAKTGLTATLTGTAVAAAALVELGNVVVPATVLELEVIGQ